jgi:hypothetical protein
MRRSVGFSARAIAALVEPGHRAPQAFMLTLTYRSGAAWEPQHVADFIRRFRKWCDRQAFECRYVWVAELQDGKRGAGVGAGRMALHYHVVVWLPAAAYVPHPDREGWWPHGSTRVDRARGAVQYLLHYLKKGDYANFVAFPRGARAFGVGGLGSVFRAARAWLSLPAAVQARASITDKWRRATGGGWLSPTGDWLPSEWQRVVVAGKASLVRLLDLGRPFPADGPYSAWAPASGVACGGALS